VGESIRTLRLDVARLLALVANAIGAGSAAVFGEMAIFAA